MHSDPYLDFFTLCISDSKSESTAHGSRSAQKENSACNRKKVSNVNLLTFNWLRMVLFRAKLSQILVDLHIHLALYIVGFGIPDPVRELISKISTSR